MTDTGRENLITADLVERHPFAVRGGGVRLQSSMMRQVTDSGRIVTTVLQICLRLHFRGGLGLVVAALSCSLHAQVAPTEAEIAGYSGLLAAAAKGNAAQIRVSTAQGQNPDARDRRSRTPLHVAAFGGHHDAMRALVAAGANPNALETDRYDIVTIAAVADQVATLKVALALGCSPKHVTSRYDGTALIAAAHLGHAEVVRTLIRAGAPLDHVNNLGWTALMEAIVLGDGGARHTDTLRALVEAGANVNLADRNGQSALALARARRYTEMVAILERAGAK